MRLEGEGLILRPFGEQDVAAIVAACRDPEVARWTSVPEPYGEEDARTFLREYVPGVHAFAITDASTTEYLGSIDVRPDKHGRASVGYLVKREARGCAVASRALRLVARWALTQGGFARLSLSTEPGNTASQQVAEKAGFKREGVLRSWMELKGERRDMIMFSLLPGDLAEERP